MTTFEKTVKNICDEVYKKIPEQILIDFIQEQVEEITNKTDPTTGAKVAPTRDDVGALSYECSLLLDVYNPVFTWDIDVLTRLQNAFRLWEKDIEQTNILLGLPKES